MQLQINTDYILKKEKEKKRKEKKEGRKEGRKKERKEKPFQAFLGYKINRENQN